MAENKIQTMAKKDKGRKGRSSSEARSASRNRGDAPGSSARPASRQRNGGSGNTARPPSRGHGHDCEDDGGRRFASSTGRHDMSSNGDGGTTKKPRRPRGHEPDGEGGMEYEHEYDNPDREGRRHGHRVGSQVETSADDMTAGSALTMPSALLHDGRAHGGRDDEEEDDDERQRRPLLFKSDGRRRRDGDRAPRRSSAKRDRRARSSGKSRRPSVEGKPSKRRPSVEEKVPNGAAVTLSHRANGGSKKRPWFASTPHGFRGRDSNGGGGPGPSDYAPLSSGTGVKYRSASSTARALEEIRRRRHEAAERRRAVGLLAVMVLGAGAMHFSGRYGGLSSMLGGGTNNGVRGSRDRDYGGAGDPTYGGDRDQAAFESALGGGAAAAVAPAAGADGGAPPDDVPGEFEYRLPPPVEKEYDDEHQYLVPLRYFSDMSDPARPTDVPYFFHVPRAGGSTVKEVVGNCLKLVQASDVGVRDGHGEDPVLQVLDIKECRYVNVDTTTVPGIQRAAALGLSSSGLADVVVSSYFHDSAGLYDLGHQGRAFIVLRDPMERAASMYWYRIEEVGDLDRSVSIEDYAQGNGIENNWMCRFIANRMTGELTKDDLEEAKEILRTKFLVGFVDDFDESLHRIMKYAGWSYKDDGTERMKQEDCIKDLAGHGTNANPVEYELPKRGSQAHALISWQTQFDSKLYSYARELFEKQTKEWGTKERKKEMKKRKKKGGGK